MAINMTGWKLVHVLSCWAANGAGQCWLPVQLYDCCCMTTVDTASVPACCGAPCLVASSWPVAVIYVCAHATAEHVCSTLSNNLLDQLYVMLHLLESAAPGACCGVASQPLLASASLHSDSNSLHQHPAIMHKSSSKSKVRLPHARQQTLA